jgi:hypothetical protein
LAGVQVQQQEAAPFDVAAFKEGMLRRLRQLNSPQLQAKAMRAMHLLEPAQEQVISSLPQTVRQVVQHQHEHQRRQHQHHTSNSLRQLLFCR